MITSINEFKSVLAKKDPNYFKNENKFPDWHSGSDFGNPRTPSGETAKKYTDISATLQKKIDAFEKKRDKIIAKLQNDKSLEVSVKQGTMRKIEKVGAKEALSLINKAIDTLRRTKSHAGGIIVYV